MRSFTIPATVLSVALAVNAAANIAPAAAFDGVVRRDAGCATVTCDVGTYCMIGDNGVPGCCPVGEICSGPGSVSTVYTTQSVNVEVTQVHTYVSTSSIYDSYYTSSSSASSYEASAEPSTTPCTTTTESVPVYNTVVPTYVPTGSGNNTYSNSTGSMHASGPAPSSYPSGSAGPHTNLPNSEGSAASTVVRMGVTGMVAVFVGFALL